MYTSSIKTLVAYEMVFNIRGGYARSIEIVYKFLLRLEGGAYANHQTLEGMKCNMSKKVHIFGQANVSLEGLKWPNEVCYVS